MNSREEQHVAVTAFIAALVEGVRLLGPRGVNEDQLYDAVSTLASRSAFDMVVAELVAQKTFKRVGPYGLVYCGPCMIKCDGNHGGPRCADPECWNQ